MFSGRLSGLRRSVGFRIAVWYAGVFIAGSMVAFATAYYLLGHSIDEQINDSIEFRLRQFTAEYARAGITGVTDLAYLKRGRANQAFFLRFADKQNVTKFLRDAEDWAEFRPERLSTMPAPDIAKWHELRSEDGNILRLGGVRLADGSILQVGRGLEDRTAVLQQFRLTLLGVGFIVIATGALGGSLFALRALRPVNRLTAAVQSILGTGQFDQRVPHGRNQTEIDELVECFNTLIQRVESLIRGMRESLDNVAHDLRTPMTHLRNVASTAIERDSDKQACVAALGECLEESETVMTMLSTLMDISEAQAGVMRLEQKTVALEPLIEHVCELYEDVAEVRGIHLSYSLPPGLKFSGDPVRLQRALGNLVDNALKYTPSGGKATIRAYVEDSQLCIEVADTGVGIPADELPRIWDRLYRVDKSRSQRGLGLGLSFVKAIVEAHQGQVTVESKLEEGSRFRMLFPLGAGPSGTAA